MRPRVAVYFDRTRWPRKTVAACDPDGKAGGQSHKERPPDHACLRLNLLNSMRESTPVTGGLKNMP